MKRLLLLSLPLLASALREDASNASDNIACGEEPQLYPIIEAEAKAGWEADLIPPPSPITALTPTVTATVTVGPSANFPGFVNARLTEYAIGIGNNADIFNATTGNLITQGTVAGTARLVRTNIAGNVFGVLFNENNIDVFEFPVPPPAPPVTLTATAHTTAPCKLGPVQDFKISTNYIAAVNCQRLIAWNWRTGVQIIADKFLGGPNAYDLNDNYLVYLQRRCLCNQKTTVLRVVDLNAPPTQAEFVIPLNDCTARSVTLNNDGTNNLVLVGFSDFALVYALPAALTPPFTYLYRIDLVTSNSNLFLSENPLAVYEVDTTDPIQFLIYKHTLPTGLTGFSVVKSVVTPPPGWTWQSLQIYENNFLVGGLSANKTLVYLGSGSFP